MVLELDLLNYVIEESLSLFMQDIDYIQVLNKLWKKDLKFGQSTLVSEYMNWIDLFKEFSVIIDEIDRVYADLISSGFKHAVIISAGSSSVAKDLYSLTTNNGGLTVLFLDSMCYEDVANLMKNVDLTETVIIYISGSGNNIDTNLLFDIIKTHMLSTVGDKAFEHFIAVTNSNSHLHRLAQKARFRTTLLFSANSWGRFRAFDYPGLLPAKLIGIDLKELTSSAQQMLELCRLPRSKDSNPSLLLAMKLHDFYVQGYRNVVIYYGTSTYGLAKWIAELLAESVGKSGKGITPFLRRTSYPFADITQHDSNFIGIVPFDNISDEAIQHISYPALSSRLDLMIVDSVMDIAKEVVRWSIAVTVLCELLEVNPFSEPDIKASYTVAEMYLRQNQYTEIELSRPLASFDNIGLFVKYISLYCSRTIILLPFLCASTGNQDTFESLIEELEKGAQSKLVTVYQGPQYLHSFGQLLKGGNNRSDCIVLTQNVESEANENLMQKLNTLSMCLAMSDILVMRRRGRHVIHVHVSDNKWYILSM